MKNHRLCITMFLLAVTLSPTLSKAEGPASYWVNPTTGSDSNAGTASAPFQHIGHAWTVAQANNLNNEATTVNLEAGTYRAGFRRFWPSHLERRHPLHRLDRVLRQ